MMQQLTLEDFLEQKVEDWVEYTGCPFCDHLIVVDYPKKLIRPAHHLPELRARVRCVPCCIG